jgi:hypothetical protein
VSVFLSRSVRIAAVGLMSGAALLSACSSSSKSSLSSSSSAASSATTEATPTTTAASSGGGTLTQAQAQAAMLKASDLGTGYTDGTFKPDDPKTPEPCGQQSVDAQIPPAFNVGSTVTSSSINAAFQEDYDGYNDAASATNAFNGKLAGVACTNATIVDDTGAKTPVTFSAPTDVTSSVGGVKAVEVDVKSTDTSANGFEGVLVAVQLPQGIVAFEFLSGNGTDTSTLPNPGDVAKQGVAKLTAA